MPSIYDLKPRFQSALRPVTNKAAAKGVTANQVTVLAMVLSFAAGGLIFLFPTRQWPLLIVPVALFVRMVLNAIDGMLAREHNMKTPLGTILNELGDVMSDVAFYLPFAFVPGVNSIWLVLVVLLGLVSEMTGCVAVQIGAPRRYDGPMGKSDRAFLFGMIALALGIGLDPQPWLDYLLIATCILLCITIVNRARKALLESR